MSTATSEITWLGNGACYAFSSGSSVQVGRTLPCDEGYPRVLFLESDGTYAQAWEYQATAPNQSGGTAYEK